MEPKIIREILQIEGMTCASCEMRIEDVLKKANGVIEVKAVYSSSKVYVTYDGTKVVKKDIVDLIEKIDYKVKDCYQNQQINEGKGSVGSFAAIGIIILAIYLIINNTIGFNFIPEVDQSMGYGILFVVGVLTSLHCIAMCGGINLSQCVSYKCEVDSKLDKIKPSLLYNAGRVVSYTIVGGIVGTLGSFVSLTGGAKGLVAVIAGSFMIIMGLNMLNIFPWLKKLTPRMPKIFGKKIYESNGKNGPFYVGLLNGLMPCGPLQSMQLYALGTGSFLAGAVSMFMFSIGTVPLMFGFGALSTILSKKFTNKMMKVSAALVMVLGIIMINRGLSLSGISIDTSFAKGSESVKSDNIATIKADTQEITTRFKNGRYTPIVVQKGIPVKWTIKIEQGDLNGCNNPITIPKYNIQKKLTVGDNLIEFTPQEEGNIVYTCWMGMISNNIKVVADVSNVTNNDLEEINGNLSPQMPLGGCCGR